MGLAPIAAAALGLFLPGAGLPGQPMVLVALMATAVLLVAAAGELLLHRNYGSPMVPGTWPRQPVSPALLTTAIAAVALFSVILAVTVAGEWKLREAGVDASRGWVVAALASVAVAAIACLPVAAARVRRGIPTGITGLDAALRAITVHRVVRTIAAYCLAQGGVLLLTAGNALAALLGLPASTSTWQPATVAGAALAAAGVVIAVIPVRGFARVPAAPAQPIPEGSR